LFPSTDFASTSAFVPTSANWIDAPKLPMPETFAASVRASA